MRLIIVSGLSGSGKTVALHHFEDLGFYCIDNVPAALLATMIGEITATKDPLYANLAIGIDARNAFLFAWQPGMGLSAAAPWRDRHI